MNYLVDTNVLSEMTKPNPSSQVINWMKNHERSIFVSTITLGELKYGVTRLPDGKKKRALQSWLKKTASIMEGTTLSFNRSVAYVWADLRNLAKQKGIELPMADGMIAAVAKRHKLTVATRNVSDFKHCHIRTVNPFE